METVSLGLIEIIRTPNGEAPLWVREAWVGRIIVCDPILGRPTPGSHFGVVTGKPVMRENFTFTVRQEDALNVLRLHDKKAYQWWEKHGFPQDGGLFGFEETEARIITGVQRQKIIHVTEEMQGQPDR